MQSVAGIQGTLMLVSALVQNTAASSPALIKAPRLNLISHLLEQIPYERVDQEKIELPPRQDRHYERPPRSTEKLVPERFRVE